MTRTIHGNVMLGPNATDVDDKDDLTTTARGPERGDGRRAQAGAGLDTRQVIRTFAGLRATRQHGRFPHRGAAASAPGLVVLAGIESPGLTASPAIAEHVVELLREAGLRAGRAARL